MAEVTFLEDVRDVYYMATTQFDVEIEGTPYQLRIAEDSNGSEELWFDGETWINDDSQFPDEVRLFFYNLMMGNIDYQSTQGDVVDLLEEEQ